MPTDPTNQPAAPTELWGLWHPEHGWHYSKTVCDKSEMDRFMELNAGGDFIAGYRPVRLVAAGSEVSEVVKMLRKRADWHHARAMESEASGNSEVSARHSGAESSLYQAVTEIEELQTKGG